MTRPNYHLIVLAREASGITQADLAANVGIEQGYLSKIENGLSPDMSPDIVRKVAYVLGYQETFFYQDWIPNRVDGHYRRKLSLPARELKECRAKMTIAERHLETLCHSVDIPLPNYPLWNVEKDGSIQMTAQHLREFWRIPKGRIPNVISVLEDHGFVIIDLDLGEVDGYSALSPTNIPVIFLNKRLTGDRYKLTAVHEAFHFILHHGQKIADYRDVESEAYEAAHEFLVPFLDIQEQLRKLTLAKLADLKQYWGLSMQSFIVRAYHEKLITKNQYQYLFKQMNALGYKKKEPVETPKEKPTLFHEIISTHSTDFGYSKEEISKLLAFKPEQIDDWYFNTRITRLKPMRKTA